MATHPNFRNRARTAIHRLLGGTTFLLVLGLAAPSAHAQWAVVDAEANETLSTIQTNTSNTATNTKDTVTQTKDINQVLGTTGDGNNKTINANLNAINQKLFIGTYSSTQPGPRVKDPAKALPADTTKLDDGKHCDLVAKPQQETCKAIVDLQNAQYQYMLTMYQNTKTRDDMLRELLKERESITADDEKQFGKLEDNTNKLTALYNLIALDQQQMQTVNYAYEANLKYLRSQQTQAAQSASTGKQPSDWGIDLPIIGDVDIGQAISGLATGAALKIALDGAQSKTPDGMQKLQISESTSYGL